MFNSYKNNCVHNNQNHENHQINGTFLSRNMYALAFNFASTEGKKEIISNENKYNKQRSQTCLKYSTSNQQEIHQITNNLTDILKLSQVISYFNLIEFN